MKKALLSFALLTSFYLIFSVSCGSNLQAPSGALPTWKVGDSWTTNYAINSDRANIHIESNSTIVQTVIGEQVINGIDCYRVNEQVSSSSIDNIMIMTITIAIDKTTLEPIETESTYVFNGTYYFLTANSSYDYSEKPYPLSVGKTWTVTANITTTGLFWEEQPETSEDRYTYVVERVEDVTVPAGTFQCFKIVQYNSSNSIESIYWVTDETAIIVPVKAIDGTIATRELISYSLSK